MIEGILGFLLGEWWWLIIWSGLIVAAFVLRGWKAAAAVATLGLGVVIYRKGRRDADAARLERDRKMRERLEHGYQGIDDRGVDRDDVTDRLRDGEF